MFIIVYFDSLIYERKNSIFSGLSSPIYYQDINQLCYYLNKQLHSILTIILICFK